MKTLISSLLLLSALLLQGCIQAPSNGRKSSVSSSATNTGSGTTSNGASYPTFATDEFSYWFTTTKITGTVTINKNSQDILYLRGKYLHDFLNTKDAYGVEYYRKQYCIVGNFSSPAYKQVRVRAIPIYVTTSTKAIERLLRIDVPSSSDNATACKYTTIDSTLPTAAAFSLPEICTNCTGQVTTTNLSLYEAKTSGLTKIDPVLLNLSSILMRVDLTSNSTDPGSSCTNSSCSAKGFDCCISGQCVKDATEKTNASLDPQYSQAKLEYAANPLSFINYPNIFYICSDIAHNPPASSGGTTTTPVSDAQARVAKYLTDYTCISDVSAGIGYNNCRDLTSSGTPTGIDKTESAYAAIKKKLAVACGCVASDAEMAVKCPDWGIVPVYLSGALQTNANITDFKCYTPQPANPIGPITNLNVSVPNRSAPHRFYSSTGVNYDDIAGLKTKAPNTVQEGDDFYYLDEYNKVGPVNGSYNINSVIGRMTIDLSRALPAKEVAVELGKTYILSATSGYFTPCSQCVKDSWFQTFSAHPVSQRGVGLQASGYTTSRDTYSANTTFGNYEDTKFGRACYVPVTMLPLSHQKNANLQTQRQNRLKTQAAFYVNGYQRDWYGFNLGALIGSFDGVTWFAIGTGRRATATSTKLYLALNASFLDLADKTDTIVNIIPDFSANTAADYDYDPDIALTDPRQNTGATCQKYHQCTVDADCVAQLGWEYMCADVSQYKTKWPLFDSDANETSNQERTAPLFEILQGTISTANGKRCVYRGQGAPCKRDYSTLSDFNKKTLTCAPNFYCASLTSNKFNDELVRSPNELNDMLFGMDANILGRPLNYVTANKSLATEVIANVKYNAGNAIGLSSNESDDMGICRPGRYLSSVDLTAHSNQDASKRSDYISQIGSCNSTTTGSGRFVTCPAFDDTLNYIDPNASDVLVQKQTQNSCGAEAKHTSTAVSAFTNIEGLSLNYLQNITQPILAQDACFRRAGSVCNSDLDCGPNKLHEDTVGTIDIKYFGGTEGEQSYWRESLICGQGTTVPVLGTAGYFDYKLSDNRCCREIGKDFTMITQGPKSIVPDNAGTNENIITNRFTYSNPQAANRYSRYTISKEAIKDSSTIPAVSTSAEPNKNQWKVVNETGSLTCCGGGWIRKFTDGTHDWKVRNRLSLDANNFTCLNFRSPLADSTYTNFAADKVVASSYQREYEYFCKSPDIGGCMQIPYQSSNGFTILSPRPYNPSSKVAVDPYEAAPAFGYTRISTTPTADPINGTTPWTQLVNSDVPYSPLPYYYSPIPYDVNPTTNKAYNFFTDKGFDYGVEMYLPAYVGWDGTTSNPTFISRVAIEYFYDAPALPQVAVITPNVASASQCNDVINITGSASPTAPIDGITTNNTWCIVSNAKTGNRPVINVHADKGAGYGNWKYAGIIIDFKPIENYRGTKVAEPGNALYYLSKLARMELIGIPQITYEPLYCNGDQNKLVPGIFKSSAALPLTTRSQFETATSTYASFDPISSYNEDGSASTTESPGYGNKDAASKSHYAYQDKLDHSAIFSSKDFTCCTPLGKTTSSAAKCCSGYAVTSSDGKTSTCKIPTGTDLNVYFNKFVSSEGVGDDQPGGGLTIKGTDQEMDFNAYTGEPKYRAATYDKLVALGSAYCSNGKVATGGAFGAFPPEPFSGSYIVQPGSTGNLEDYFPMSIVDSVLDFQTSDPNVGKVPFDSGYKWNHHYYCK
ncbi:MAG: hypothetical protein ACXVLQ_05690 [Bacteriovorax sp.]